MNSFQNPHPVLLRERVGKLQKSLTLYYLKHKDLIVPLGSCFDAEYYSFCSVVIHLDFIC